MKATETLDVENLETEVVVIGGGGAGLAAAVAAREKGVDVAILEKRRTVCPSDVFGLRFYGLS